jgi:protein-disulfide isomerase
MKLFIFAVAAFVSASASLSALGQQAPLAASEKTVTVASPSNPAATKEAESCGCETASLPETLAVVNSVKITAQDIEAPTKLRINELQRQVIVARQHELELQINSRLLKAEAAKRSLSPVKLIQTEVVAKVQEPTEADALAFYDKNKGRINGDFKTSMPGIIKYLRGQRESEEAGRFAERLRATAQVKILSANAAPAFTEAERARVVAEVNGTPITSGNIEDSLRPLIFHVQRQVYEVRYQELERRVLELLLAQEALKRKITVEALLATDLAPKVPKVEETAVREFYEQNKERLIGDYSQLKEQITQHLQQLEVEKAETAFAEQLRRSATLQVFLEAPVPPVYNISTAARPAKGNTAAPVTIIEFTDYQCQSCSATQPVIEKLVGEYGDKVRLVVRHFPLPQHRQAGKAAEAAEAAFEQHKFWEYAALLTQNQSALEVAKLKEYATRAGLDRSKFDAALDSGKFAAQVQRDMEEGMSYGINSTPAIFVNGRQSMSNDYETLKAAIESVLKNTVAKN